MASTSADWNAAERQIPTEYGEPCDISLRIGCKVFPCHRNILIAHSLYFEHLFNGNFKEANDDTVSLPDEYVDGESFSKLLVRMYGEPFRIENDLLPLLASCSYLQLIQLMKECEQYILRNLKEINLPELILLPQFREYSSSFIAVKKYICRNFVEIYEQMIHVPFELLKELLEFEELLIFSRDKALKFCNLWLSHLGSERKRYQKEITRLKKPFQNHIKIQVINQCMQYMESNFHIKDWVELFVSLQKRDERQPLYRFVRGYISRHFSRVNTRDLVEIPFPVFKDLFSRTESFDFSTCSNHVVDFGKDWLNYDRASRNVYRKKVLRLIRPFDEYYIDYDFIRSLISPYVTEQLMFSRKFEF